jgi:hypothetical protein
LVLRLKKKPFRRLPGVVYSLEKKKVKNHPLHMGSQTYQDFDTTSFGSLAKTAQGVEAVT